MDQARSRTYPPAPSWSAWPGWAAGGPFAASSRSPAVTLGLCCLHQCSHLLLRCLQVICLHLVALSQHTRSCCGREGLHCTNLSASLLQTPPGIRSLFTTCFTSPTGHGLQLQARCVQGPYSYQVGGFFLTLLRRSLRSATSSRMLPTSSKACVAVSSAAATLTCAELRSSVAWMHAHHFSGLSKRRILPTP